MAKENLIELGDLVKDKITGFEGVVTGYTKWLTGCDRVVVQPRQLGDSGHLRMTESFDISQIDVIEKNVIKLNQRTKEEKKSGGPMPTPKPW